MTTDTITIWHGYEADGHMVFPLGEPNRFTPHSVVRAYSYETDRTELDQIYRDNNAVDGTEVNVQNSARSLSVGDIIECRGMFTVVSELGFDHLSNGDLPASIERITAGELLLRRDALNRR